MNAPEVPLCTVAARTLVHTNKSSQLHTSHVGIYCLPKVHSKVQGLAPSHFVHLCICTRTVSAGEPFHP